MKKVILLLHFYWFSVFVISKKTNLNEYCTEKYKNETHNFDILCENLDLSDWNKEMEFHNWIAEIKSMAFRNCSVPVVPQKLMQLYNRGFALDVSGKGVKSIHVLDIHRIVNLNVSHNLFSEITKKMFNSLWLINLDLSYNFIENIEEFAFKNLSNMKRLDLSNNALKELKQYTFSIKHDYYGCCLSIDLSNNKIQNIEKNCFQNANLFSINLQKNELQTITPEIFQGAGSLRLLILNDNLIERIENNSFSELEELLTINLSNNRLTTIENNTFNGLQKIAFINLNNNLIQIIKDNSFLHKTLKLILLRNNQLKVIQGSAFRRIPNNSIGWSLLEIDLSMNPLEKVYFNEEVGITFLNLAFGNLKRFENVTFKGLPRLRTLVLLGNEIEKFDVSVLHPLRKLEHLYLTGNKLKEIDYEDQFFRVPKIDLTYNRWNCTYLRKMMNVLNQRKVQYLISNEVNTTKSIAGVGCIEDENETKIHDTSMGSVSTVDTYLKNMLDVFRSEKMVKIENFYFYYM